jgi:hypothetical protein
MRMWENVNELIELIEWVKEWKSLEKAGSMFVLFVIEGGKAGRWCVVLRNNETTKFVGFVRWDCANGGRAVMKRGESMSYQGDGKEEEKKGKERES